MSGLAGAIRAEAARAAKNGRAVTLARVSKVSPLTLEELTSRRVLNEDEVTLSQAVKERLDEVAEDDVMVLARRGASWIALTVVSDAAPVSRATQADLDAVTDRLNAAETILSFPTANNVLDVPVPSGTSLVTLDFEAEYPSGATVSLQPNGDTTSLQTMYSGNTSTLSPNVAAALTVGLAAAPGLYLADAYGASGGTRAIGQAKVATRNYSGRTLMNGDVTMTSIIGAANAYLYRFTTQAAYDLAVPIAFLRLKTSAGNFNGGVVHARYA